MAETAARSTRGTGHVVPPWFVNDPAAEIHQIGRGGRYGLRMANDSIHDRRTTTEPFDQDSAGVEPQSKDSGVCRECHARRCANCAKGDCTCAHPFAAVARAIVELDVSVHRTWRVLGQAGVTPKKNA
jgi:hypothetical protein